MSRISMIIHGGAWEVGPEAEAANRRGCIQAAQVGWALLQQGSSALDAAEAAVKVLEDDATFDAGRGSFANLNGEVEMDALIMDGATLASGAIAAIQRVRHPVSIARMVMEKTPHSLVVGAGAEAFARAMKVPVTPPEYLLPPRGPAKPAAHDTVGVIALDARGSLAVATSTGGIPDKMPGRVGDTPQVGCGAYADNQAGAAAATGKGEDLMKLVISKLACDLMAGGLSAQAAADAALHRLEQRVQGYGGLITMSPDGEVGFAYNTPGMPRAWFGPDGELHVAVFRDA